MSKTTELYWVKIPTSKLELNEGQLEGLPTNPRYIKDERFAKLKLSLESSPEFLEANPLKVYPLDNGNYIIIGGNMRFLAGKKIGMKDFPCYIFKKSTTIEKLMEYAAKDNISFGSWDYDSLANNWDAEELLEWGAEIPEEWIGNDSEDTDVLDGDNNASEVGEDEDDEDEEFDVKDILFASDNDFEIPTLKLSEMAGNLELPVTPWGANSRLRKDVNTYHFYVDDYRFEKLFKDPVNLLTSGCKAIVEPNCSLHDQTPIAWGLQLIYKKRWLARYCQDCGIKVYADLNVASKFAEYNTLGIPKGWNAFFTRGSYNMLKSLEVELEIARRISGKEQPNLIVYGGGKEIQKICQNLGLLYVHDFINEKDL